MPSCLNSAAGDWLQGPYVYALYQHYGFDRGDIGRLFIAGFGSSMVFGTIVGSLADRTCDVLTSEIGLNMPGLYRACQVALSHHIGWFLTLMNDGSLHSQDIKG